MDVVLGKACFSWSGRTRFKSAFSLFLHCLGLCVERRRKKTPLCLPRCQREWEAEIALFLNLSFWFVFSLSFSLCVCSYSEGLPVSLHCPRCSGDLDWRWFLCLICLPWLCLSLYMHASLPRLAFALHSCCVVALVDIFVRTPACVSFLLNARPSFLQTRDLCWRVYASMWNEARPSSQCSWRMSMHSWSRICRKHGQQNE